MCKFLSRVSLGLKTKQAHPPQSVMTLRRARIISLYSTRGTTQIADSIRHFTGSQNPWTLTQSCGAGLLSRGSYRRDFFRPARELQIFQPCSWLAPTANSLETVSKNPLRQGLLIQIIISQLVLFVNYFIWVKPCKISCHNKQFFVVFHTITACCAGSCR